jgi:hypothetical protein
MVDLVVFLCGERKGGSKIGMQRDVSRWASKEQLVSKCMGEDQE